MKVRRQLSGVGSLHFYVGSWDPTQATRLTQQVPLLLHRSVFVILTQHGHICGEGITTEKLSSSDWPLDKPVGRFLD